MRIILALGLLAAFIGGSAQFQTAQAQATPEAVIAGRQAAFDLQSAMFGVMKAAIDAKTDVKPLKNGADAIAAWGHALPGMFPAGTETGKTKALPAIWSDRPGFDKLAGDLAAAAMKMSVAADANDKDAFADAWKATGAACGGCHRTYRAR